LLLPWLAWSEAADRQRWRAVLSGRVIAPSRSSAASRSPAAPSISGAGESLTFANLTENIFYRDIYPERLVVLDCYGEFSVARIGYALMYYFLPVWAIISPNHEFLFASFQRRTIDSVKMPPSSFFLTDPLLILLTAIFLSWRSVAARPRNSTVDCAAYCSRGWRSRD
jgi:hypothetical protein